MGESIADVTERLMAEFHPAVPLDTVSDVVLRTRRDLLSLVPPHALASALDRLARTRLRELARG